MCGVSAHYLVMRKVGSGGGSSNVGADLIVGSHQRAPPSANWSCHWHYGLLLHCMQPWSFHRLGWVGCNAHTSWLMRWPGHPSPSTRTLASVRGVEWWGFGGYQWWRRYCNRERQVGWEGTTTGKGKRGCIRQLGCQRGCLGQALWTSKSEWHSYLWRPHLSWRVVKPCNDISQDSAYCADIATRPNLDRKGTSEKMISDLHALGV